MASPQPAVLYSYGLNGILLGQFNLNPSTSSFALILAAPNYVPAPASHSLYSDVSPFELPSGNGYTQGGLLLQGATLSAPANVFNSGPVTWPALAAGPFRYAICLHVSNGQQPQASDRLLFCSDLTGDGSSVSGIGAPYAVQPSTAGSGWFSVSHTP